MKTPKLGIALLLLILVTGCHWGWIKKTNGRFELQPSYVSVIAISKYHVLTYQVVSPDLCALLTYHTTADEEHPVPYMAGIQVQDLAAGKETYRFIGLNGIRSEAKRLNSQAVNLIRNSFAGSTAQQTQMDGHSIALPPRMLQIKKAVRGQTLTLEGEIRDLARDKCFSPLFNGEKACFKIVIDPQTRLPVNEYYWTAGATVVRYVFFPADSGAEIDRMKRLDSLVKVQEFLAERRIFDHLRFDLEDL